MRDGVINGEELQRTVNEIWDRADPLLCKLTETYREPMPPVLEQFGDNIVLSHSPAFANRSPHSRELGKPGIIRDQQEAQAEQLRLFSEYVQERVTHTPPRATDVSKTSPAPKKPKLTEEQLGLAVTQGIDNLIENYHQGEWPQRLEEYYELFLLGRDERGRQISSDLNRTTLTVALDTLESRQDQMLRQLTDLIHFDLGFDSGGFGTVYQWNNQDYSDRVWEFV
jgi:hypothetical protein